VENLSGGSEGLPQALETLDKLETAMHKMTGIPQTALGEELAVSNTSGVALAIQFQPAMNMHGQKVTQYGEGLRKVNSLVLRHLFIFEPDTIYYNPNTDGIKQDDQADFVDPNDPAVYDVECDFPPPLPVDILIKLNEIQVKMALGLESKKGALRDLGDEFPDEKLQELFEEQLQDERMSAAKQLIRAHMGAVTMALTGIVPEGAGEPAPNEPTQNADGSTTAPEPPPAVQQLPELPDVGNLTDIIGDQASMMINDIVTQAYGTKLPQRRVVDKNDNSND
jgi:Phage portal protein, SPP1 Gp6-like